MSDAISVTEVRNALRCPRIFALGRSGQRGAVAFPVGSSLLGAAFHRIVEAFARDVASPPPYFAALGANPARDDMESALVRWLTAGLMEELDRVPDYWSMPSEVDDLAEALRELARHLAGRVQAVGGGAEKALKATLRSGEQSLEATLDTGERLRGRLDAVYAARDGATEIIEYKLTDEANEELDRAQVALYRWLLGQAGVEARPIILRFAPTLRETTVAAMEADALVKTTLVPLIRDMARWAADPKSAPATRRPDLCSACPLAAPCAATYPAAVAPRDVPPVRALSARPPPPEAAPPPPPAGGEAEAAKLREQILAELRKAGVAATAKAPHIGPTLISVEVKAERVSVSKLDAAAKDVVHRLADVTKLAFESEGGHRVFIGVRKDRRPVLLGALVEAKRAWLSASAGRFLVGELHQGGILTGDLADGSTPHLLIGGQSGSGKSVLLRTIVASLAHFHSPDAIRFTLVDPKRVTFKSAAFEAKVAAYLDGPIRYDVEEALPVLEGLEDEMESRYRLFDGAKVEDVPAYNEARPPSERLARHVVVMDEFQDLTVEKSLAAAFYASVKRLGAKARAAGIHLVLATQRPDKDTVPGIIKGNLGGRIALRVDSHTASKIILDSSGAEKLLGRGDLLANLGMGRVRAQAASID